jgi:hypothetical protein
MTDPDKLVPIRGLIGFFLILWGTFLIAVAWVGHLATDGHWPNTRRFWIATVAGALALPVGVHMLRYISVPDIGRSKMDMRRALLVFALLFGGAALLTGFFNW